MRGFDRSPWLFIWQLKAIQDAMKQLEGRLQEDKAMAIEQAEAQLKQEVSFEMGFA